MPRFYFHIDDGRHCPDETGYDLADLEAAQAEALRAASGILHSQHSLFSGAGDWQMNVTDGDHRLLFTLRFSANTPSGPMTYRPT